MLFLFSLSSSFFFALLAAAAGSITPLLPLMLFLFSGFAVELAVRLVFGFDLGAVLEKLDDSFEVLLEVSDCAAKSFHLRQPSKSMRACMHPHSLTLRSSQTKLTGYIPSLVSKNSDFYKISTS